MRLRFLPLACVLALMPAGAMAQATPDVTVKLLELDPPAASSLPLRSTLYGRVTYRTDTPVRFSLRPYRNGQPLTKDLLTSNSPRYPAGSGEALVWVAFNSPQAIDEVRAIAHDRSGNVVFAETSLRRSLSWQGEGTAPPPADWVEPLLQAAAALRAQAHQESGGLEPGPMLLTMVLFLSVPLSVVLQVAAWRKLEGNYRSLAGFSAFAMAALWLFVILTGLAGSNLSPIWLVFLSPLFVLFLLALFVLQSRSHRGAARA